MPDWETTFSEAELRDAMALINRLIEAGQLGSWIQRDSPRMMLSLEFASASLNGPVIQLNLGEDVTVESLKGETAG
jgi:hypothetical protein